MPSFAVVFGSQVRGIGDPRSDMGLAVGAPALDGGDARTAGLLWRVADRTGSRIEPIACGAVQRERDDTSAILEIARREGVHIAA